MEVNGNHETHRHRRLPALDGLRYLAALSVVVFHLVACADNGLVDVWGKPSADVFGAGHLVASYGWVGVPLFFMISGFVICMTSWNRTPADYAVSRFVRLYPAFWACVLLTAFITVLHPDVFRPISIRALLVNLTMLPDPLDVPRLDNVYWTLWLELKFYLLFLAVLWRGTTYRRVVTFCLAWTIASILAGEAGLPWLDALLLRGHSQYFIAGIALYLVHRHGSRPILWIIIGLSWILSMHYYAGNPWQATHGRSYAPASVLITVCFAVMTLLALGKLDRLRWRGLTVLGTASYPLYLLHNVAGSTAIHAVRQHVTAAPVWLLAGALIVLTGLSLLVHGLIERPLAPRLKALLTRTQARPAPLQPDVARRPLSRASASNARPSS